MAARTFIATVLSTTCITLLAGSAALAQKAPPRQPPEWAELEAELKARQPRPPRAAEPAKEEEDRFLHGLRLGYGLFLNHDDPKIQKVLRLETPSTFLLGYELAYRMIGGEWLNLLFIGNTTVAGLEQSKFLPSLNLLLGAEFRHSFQVGLGLNLSPWKSEEERLTLASHMIAAFGWTPKIGDFYTPIHVYFIPDVQSAHRAGLTVGVNF
jgi:hypothetical protein